MMKKLLTSELLPDSNPLFYRTGRRFNTYTLWITILLFALTASPFPQNTSSKNFFGDNYDYHWECIGPPGGWVNSLAINPQNPEIVFGGTNNGFVFKSTDGGFTSELIDTEFPRRNVPVISPLDPDFMIVSFYRTTDGGVSWDSMETSGWSYAFHPFDENIIYAINGLTNGNIIISYNKGLNWDTLTTFPNQTLRLLKTSNILSDVFFLSIQGGNILLKSYDAGINWDTVLFVPNSVISRFDKAGFNQDYIYVLAADNSFYRSSDGGINWEQRTSPPSTSINAMVINPQKPDTIYLASGDYLYGPGGSVLKSSDGGSSWAEINNGLPIASNRFLYSLVINPLNPENIYLGTLSWGVYKTTNGGENWEWTNLTIAPVFSIYIDDKNPDIIYACGSGGGVLKTINGGLEWQPLNLNVHQTVLTPFYKITFDPNNNDLAYIASQYGLHKSIDGSISWNLTTLLGNDDHSVYEVTIHPNNSDTIYAGTVGYLGPKDLFRSTDQANTWTNLQVTNGAGVSKILFDPTNPDIIYVGAFEKGIFKSTNKGQNWQTINNGLKITDPPLVAAINSLDIDESNPNILYFDNGGVVKTTNGGAEWFRIDSTLFELEPNAKVSRIAFINNKIYASSKNYVPGNNTYYSDGGLYVTSDNGLLWEKIGRFQIYFEVGEIKNNPLNLNEIYISTMNGIYKGVDTVTSVEIINEPPETPILYQNFLNPFNSTTQIKYSIVKDGMVTLKIYDVLGREIATLVNEEKQVGAYSVSFDASDLSSGIYFYSIAAGNFHQTKKMILLR
jgi:photosystem II stability/assembly factor-like uncharacterized protein